MQCLIEQTTAARLGRCSRCIAYLEVREQVRIEQGDVARGGARSGEMQVVDQNANFRPSDRAHDRCSIAERAHTEARQELQHQPHCRVAEPIGKLTQPYYHPVLVIVEAGHEHVPHSERNGSIDKRFAVIAVRGQHHRLHVECNQTSVVESTAHLGCNGGCPLIRIEPDACSVEACVRSGANRVSGAELGQGAGGEREQTRHVLIMAGDTLCSSTARFVPIHS